MKSLLCIALFWPLAALENTYPAWSTDGAKLVFESTPVFTPDAQFIVYASGQDGNLDNFRMRVDGSKKEISPGIRAPMVIRA